MSYVVKSTLVDGAWVESGEVPEIHLNRRQLGLFIELALAELAQPEMTQVDTLAEVADTYQPCVPAISA